MKKLLFILTILFTTLSAKAGCDFSGITFKTINQQDNSFYFQTNMHMDSCWYYTFTTYSYLNDEEYNLDNNGGWTGVTFNQKGKYEVRLNVFNECEKCDTIFTIDVDITIFGKDATCTVESSPNDCKVYKFQMKNFWDTCTEYFYQVWKGDDWVNNLSDTEWKNASDSLIYFDYSWEEDLLEYYTEDGKSPMMQYRFNDSGRYLVIPSYYNKCTQIDTWMFTKVNVCTPMKTTSTKNIVKAQDIKIIGYYDMLGRKVDYMEPNKLYVIIYNNGRRQKVVRTR